ncbi:High mobility group, superfamily [Metarhizium rileyi]|uniref:High mobility group, superfamily n=1 Tax=Metarhizium rileyi (strain RCEF 4871) TaxID=1649241 RepID=A0A167AQ41_METRR|nr:High mobility group, superfamily [Metarhizium rileyi RCEF 4871]TWU73972.1 hypothetical protein ED733_005252 [Metarhizium rileyi]
MATRNDSSTSEPLIETALSILAGQYGLARIDPEEYANRSAAERRRKADDEGKVSRPLNSFLLYRKAYQEVARRVLSNDQQQFASQIVGISWRLYEPEKVKNEFRALAKIDNQMHRKAFPDYKYTPTQGKKSKSGAPGSRKLSHSTKRRACRRFRDKEEDPHGTSGKKLRLNQVEALGHHQSDEGNINMSWWQQGPPGYTNIMMNYGGHHDRYEQPLASDSRYYDSQYPDVLDENSFSHMSTQPAQLTASPADYLGTESCIDPSLFSAPLEGIHIPRSVNRFLGFQPQETPAVPDFHPVTPEVNSGHPANPGYEVQEDWPVHHIVDERQNALVWHTAGEKISR